MVELPTGTVTFLFTDLEGSTRLWEEHPEAMQGALARHDEILRDAIEAHGGHVVKTTGDGLHAAFATAHDAVARRASTPSVALAAEPWALPAPLHVRMGIHTGAAELRDGDYYGTAVNRAARGVRGRARRPDRRLARDRGGRARPCSATSTSSTSASTACATSPAPSASSRWARPGLAADFPPLRSLDAFPGNLPPQLTSFVGRDDEIARRSRRRCDEVAARHAHRRRRRRQDPPRDRRSRPRCCPRFPDGAWLCELAAASDPDAMVQVVAATLGVQPRPSDDRWKAASSSFLRAKRLLVVLDNCEHLLDAAGDLAEGDPPRVSRRAAARDEPRRPRRRTASRSGRCGRSGPRRAVRPTTWPSATAGRLFVERAQAAAPGFALDASNASAVAEICRRLDGIPLAIELAAARVAAMSPTEIADLLDERFRLLTGGRRTAVERHQTLRATVDWSYSLLEPDERLVFDRLGVFVGRLRRARPRRPWWPATASRRGTSSTRSASLVAKSMVDAEKTADGHDPLPHARDAPPVRTRAARRVGRRRRVAPPPRPSTTRRSPSALGPDLRGPDELAARRHIRLELDNLRAAVTWALDRDDADDIELGVAHHRRPPRRGHRRRRQRDRDVGRARGAPRPQLDVGPSPRRARGGRVHRAPGAGRPRDRSGAGAGSGGRAAHGHPSGELRRGRHARVELRVRG